MAVLRRAGLVSTIFVVIIGRLHLLLIPGGYTALHEINARS